ncbi:MAG: 5-formyltetrahydrofolate cyclo-ligase [Fibromonadaceae bacterium]|jgi:ribonuclease D|nr:5-formyltetrahydrofolate cyclo-ligase [Fibromonadaceae bacterium]
MFFSSLLHKLFPPKFEEEALGFIDTNPEYILVDNKNSFKKMLAILNQASACVMDTEADSMHHYQEKLSLIQISVGKYHWLLDPLCGLNLKPLWKCKAMKQITFHACDYDLRLLARFHKFHPKKIYDTSIAAKLLGEKQTGLAALVEKYFKIKLDKENQRADWTKRPLSPEMCCYAVLDTIYLDAMRESQCEKLRKLGRIEWLQESCESLLKKSKTNQSDGENCQKESWRLKGSNAFKPLELQLLRAAWQWRDQEAEKRDLASYRILSPYFILGVAKTAAKARGKIDERNLPKIPRNLRGKLLQSFLAKLNAAATAPESEFPNPIPRKATPRTAINEDLREKLRELRNEEAMQLKIDSGLLAKQNQLNVLADELNGNWEEKFEVAEFMNWQREIWRVLVTKAVLPKNAAELRTWAKERILGMSEESKAKENENLLLALSKHPALQNGYIAAFYPTKFEPQIIPLLKQLAHEGRLLLPRTLNKKMEFALVQNFEEDLQAGTFGIMEPKRLPAFEGVPAAFLVPGVVFGKDGTRIGHGAGYYDRFLATSKGIPKLGIAYSAQIRSSLPQNATDVRMNEVVRATV